MRTNAVSSLGRQKTKDLVMKGMQASISARSKAGLSLKDPICIYNLCESNGVTVRFNEINMEGMYERSGKPRIHISALRPLARRNFTCAHEMGHHTFGHGSTIDELKNDLVIREDKHPNEILADAFAAFVLMPTLGLREAFARRGINPNRASAREIYAIACNFGVGQSTMVNHLAYGIEEMNHVQRATLGKITPKLIKAELVGKEVPETLVYADQHWSSPFLDMEVGALLLLPAGVVVNTAMLMPESELSAGRLFRAERPGITRVVIPGTNWATYVRIAPKQYVGLARYRHLEDAEND